MNNRAIYILMVVCIVLISGCSNIKAKIDESSNPFKPSFVISTNGLRSAPAHVGDVFVITKEGGKYIDVWRIEHIEPGKPPILEKIIYGAVPNGYREITPPQELHVGRVYVFVARLSEISDRVVFKIIDKDGKPIIQILDKDLL